MEKPKISVLITVYNEEEFIEDTIKSVLNQTFKDFELIIVNDGSTDNTEKIIRTYIKKDRRIVYLKKLKNKGYENLHNIINIGLGIAKGKYVARLDADDLCYRNRLEMQYKYLEKHPKIFLIGSSAEIINSKNKKIGEMIKKPWPPFLLKLFIGFNNPFIHSSVMFRNDGLKYPSHSEYFFFVEAMIRKKKLKNLRKKLIKYRINPHGLTAKNSDISKNKYKDYF